MVLERHEGIRQRRLHWSLRWHRGHHAPFAPELAPRIESSGAFFDEFGRLHCVRYLQAHFARFEIRVRYGIEASGMEPVIV